MFTRGRHEFFQVGRVGGECADTFALLFLIVVSHLDEQIIARPDRAHQLVEAVFSDEAVERFSGFTVIGDSNFGFEEARKHLAPTVERLAGLIGGGGIAGDV